MDEPHFSKTAILGGIAFYPCHSEGHTRLLETNWNVSCCLMETNTEKFLTLTLEN
jgi:hypothetical protein